MYLEKFKLTGKSAIITGGGQGIGLACAEALAEAGAKVIIADRDGKVADTARAGLKAKGYDAEAVVMDVTDTKRVSDVANDLSSIRVCWFLSLTTTKTCFPSGSIAGSNSA